MSDVVNWLGGNSSNPGALGIGDFQSNPYNINQGAFNNPNYVPGQYQEAANNYLGSASAPISNANYNAATAGQFGLANTYAQMAAGNGPSAATVAAQQQGAANLAQSESMLGSARGAGSPAAAQLAAKNAATSGQQQVAQNAVAGKTQEELGALQGQAGLYGNIAGTGAQIGEANQANNLAAQTNYINTLSAQGLAQQQGAMGGQQLGVEQQNAINAANQQGYAASATQRSGLFGGALSGAGVGIAALAM